MVLSGCEGPAINLAGPSLAWEGTDFECGVSVG
jgi:hypothetical protein